VTLFQLGCASLSLFLAKMAGFGGRKILRGPTSHVTRFVTILKSDGDSGLTALPAETRILSSSLAGQGSAGFTRQQL
jgi:hypothetical protein